MQNEAPQLSKRIVVGAVLLLVIVVGGILLAVGLANGGDSETLDVPGDVSAEHIALPASASGPVAG